MCCNKSLIPQELRLEGAYDQGSHMAEQPANFKYNS